MQSGVFSTPWSSCCQGRAHEMSSNPVRSALLGTVSLLSWKFWKLGGHSNTGELLRSSLLPAKNVSGTSRVLLWLCSCWLGTAASEGKGSSPLLVPWLWLQAAGRALQSWTKPPLSCCASFPFRDHLADEVIGSFSPSGEAS